MNNPNIDISVVVPMYCEEENIQNSITTIMNIVDQLNVNYELIIIDDGSTDKTWKLISDLAKQISNIKGISFSRNFGKENALYAGLSYSRGSAVITIDGDLQHPPELILEMYKLWEYDSIEVVDIKKSKRPKEPIFYKMSSFLFYYFFKKLSGIDIANATDFKLLDRKVVDSILLLPESQRFYRGITNWVGFNHVTIETVISERKFGKSKWDWANLSKYAINNISSFTSRPLIFIGSLGLLFLFSAIILMIISIIRIITGTTQEGFPTVILLMLFIGGSVIISQCLIGFYLSKVFDEVKNRPSFIIKELINL